MCTLWRCVRSKKVLFFFLFLFSLLFCCCCFVPLFWFLISLSRGKHRPLPPPPHHPPTQSNKVANPYNRPHSIPTPKIPYCLDSRGLSLIISNICSLASEDVKQKERKNSGGIQHNGPRPQLDKYNCTLSPFNCWLTVVLSLWKKFLYLIGPGTGVVLFLIDNVLILTLTHVVRNLVKTNLWKHLNKL